MQEKKRRYGMIDSLRGLALVNMVIFHLCYDLKYVFGLSLNWYAERGVYWWQQCICWGFVLISGFTWNLGRKKVKRGVQIFLAGLLITVVTYLVMPSEQIFFGVLNFIGVCVLLMIPADKFLKKWNPWAGLFVSLVLFGFCKNISAGYLGFFRVPAVRIPEGFYANYFTAILGFPFEGFYSSDYVPLLPGIFMFAAGYFLWNIISEKEEIMDKMGISLWGLEWFGKNSLWIYMIHQPVLMGILTVLFYLH